MAISVGLQAFQSWQDALDKAAATGVDASSLRLESDGSVTGDQPDVGRVILGAMYDPLKAAGAPGAGTLNLLPGLNAAGMTATADQLLAALKDLLNNILAAIKNALSTGGDWLLWLFLAAVAVIIIIGKIL